MTRRKRGEAPYLLSQPTTPICSAAGAGKVWEALAEEHFLLAMAIAPEQRVADLVQKERA